MIMNILIFLIIVCYNNSVQALMGGTMVEEHQHPYMVSLRAPTHYCGGAIIAKNWILTTASCIDEYKPADIEIRVGTILRNCPNSGHNVKAKELIKHDKFQNDTLLNDIGLILLETELDLEANPSINNIELPNFEDLKPEHKLTFIGWGSLRHRGRMPNALHKADFKVYDHAACRRIVNSEQHPICTYSSRSLGACDRDNGGPLILELVSKHYIVGVYSKGYPPCGSGLPDVFTRVFEYEKWIRGQINSHPD